MLIFCQVIFYNAAANGRAAGAEVLSTSPGSLEAVFLVTHFEKRQDGWWRRDRVLVSGTLGPRLCPGPQAPPWTRVPPPTRFLICKRQSGEYWLCRETVGLDYMMSSGDVKKPLSHGGKGPLRFKEASEGKRRGYTMSSVCVALLRPPQSDPDPTFPRPHRNALSLSPI